MSFFISNAFAEATTAAATATTSGEPSMLANLFPLVLIFVIFYFMLIRPQQAKLKAHSDLVQALKKGDEVVTSGGIMGKVVKVDEDARILHVEIASDVVVRVNRTSVSEVVGKKEKAAEGKPAKKSAAKDK